MPEAKLESSVLEKNKPVLGDQKGNGTTKAVTWLPGVEDNVAKSGKEPMNPLGPWATGAGLSMNPEGVLTGTRPVVNYYSTTTHSYQDWKDYNKNLLGASAGELHRINTAEYNGRRGLECISASADKNQYINTERIGERIHELVRWKSEVEGALTGMMEEIDELENSRKRLDSARSALILAKSINGECLARRSMRESYDLANDKVEQQLVKECSLLNEVSELYVKTLSQINDQMARNHAMKAQLETDWSDKHDTLRILNEISHLKSSSRNVLFKPAATRFSENQLSIEGWENNTRNLLATADGMRTQSSELRGLIHVTILGGCAADIKGQADQVDIALARRIAETDEMAKAMGRDLEILIISNAGADKLVGDLQQGVRNLDTAMKVAQTRLDNLQHRPGTENCRDISQIGLLNEVKSLTDQGRIMRDQLSSSESSLQELVKSRGNLEKEIQIKLKTLYIDKERCQAMRSQYPSSTSLIGH